ncbi:MAG: hypothetical protein CM1200mP41_39720 [Gammaproteobacteria bacterium]|nr:MAG: hypothetical protein CM1200mP41_39720 [Gammaproteobacteria bacterium]
MEKIRGYFFVEQINEMTLRHHARMPGESIVVK